MSMKLLRRALTSSALTLVLAGSAAACGEEDQNRAEDPAAPTLSSTPAGTEVPTEGETATAGAPEVVTIVSGSAAGGEVEKEATVLEEDGALDAYLERFDSPRFVADLRNAAEAVPLAAGRFVALAVIHIACDAPPSATVVEEDGAFIVSAAKVTAPRQECFAPVTSVAVLDVPDL